MRTIDYTQTVKLAGEWATTTAAAPTGGFGIALVVESGDIVCKVVPIRLRPEPMVWTKRLLALK